MFIYEGLSKRFFLWKSDNIWPCLSLYLSIDRHFKMCKSWKLGFLIVSSKHTFIICEWQNQFLCVTDVINDNA